MKQIARWYLVAAFVYYAPNVNAQPAPCDAKDGRGIVACVAATYPVKLASNVTAAERTANMQFLRNRLIETARCAGLDVGLNLKRGGPTISNDFIAWRNGAVLEGVDIASAYDDVTIPLKLQWHRYGPPDYGFPFYAAYGPVSCLIPPDQEPTPPPSGLDVTAVLERIAAVEAALRQQDDRLRAALTDVRAQIAVLESRPIPTACAARGPWGMPVRCELR